MFDHVTVMVGIVFLTPRGVEQHIQTDLSPQSTQPPAGPGPDLDEPEPRAARRPHQAPQPTPRA